MHIDQNVLDTLVADRRASMQEASAGTGRRFDGSTRRPARSDARRARLAALRSHLPVRHAPASAAVGCP